MNNPTNILLPFFAYGIFKPGQLAFFQIREYVSKVREPVYCKGSLLLRDGLPIIVKVQYYSSVQGQYYSPPVLVFSDII